MSGDNIIKSPIFTSDQAICIPGKSGLNGIAPAFALAEAAVLDDDGQHYFIQTDAAGQELAQRALENATDSVIGWVKSMGLLMAQANLENVDDDEITGVAWSFVGMAELLEELHRARLTLDLPTMETVKAKTKKRRGNVSE